MFPCRFVYSASVSLIASIVGLTLIALLSPTMGLILVRVPRVRTDPIIAWLFSTIERV